MKKAILIILTVGSVLVLSSCRQIENKKNSFKGDNFEITRKVTVINVRNNNTIFEIQGKIAINYDEDDQQLEIMKKENGEEYEKHIIGLNENITYIMEDLTNK